MVGRPIERQTDLILKRSMYAACAKSNLLEHKNYSVEDYDQSHMTRSTHILQIGVQDAFIM